MSDVRQKHVPGYGDFKYVNRNHHTSCFAVSDEFDLTLNLPKRPPDPYTVPAAAQTFLKVKDAGISEYNILNLCRTARVYFNSDKQTAYQRKLKKRYGDVSSPKRVKQTDKKLIPLEGFESKVRRSKQRFAENFEHYTADDERKNDDNDDDRKNDDNDDDGDNDDQPTSRSHQYSLNPHPVLPEIKGTRKSHQELSPHSTNYSRSQKRHRRSHFRDSSKANCSDRSKAQHGGTRRRGYGGSYSDRVERRGNNSDDDYSDDE